MNKLALPTLAAATLLSASAASAALINLNASDGLGASSFAAGTNWVGGAAPTGGNTYSVGAGLRLRTPASASPSLTFAGDSLTIANGFTTSNMNGASSSDLFGFTYKSTGTGGGFTINNLILNAGAINHLNGIGDTFNIAGAISVVGDSAIRAKQGNINISSAISGTSDLYLGATDGLSASRAINFSGNNSFTGDLISTATTTYFTLTNTGTFSFDIGAAGVNNRIFGLASTNGTAIFNGTFSFNLASAAATLGASWTIVDNATLLESYGGTFSVAGFTNSGGGVWTNGSYEFNQGTGVLTSMIPEPSSFASVFGAIMLGFAATRRRRQA
jgi:hypothetical protein